MIYRLFNSVCEEMSKSDDLYHVQRTFDVLHKNSCAGWIEDETGAVIAGRKPISTINIEPTWTGMLPILLLLLDSATPDARTVAIEELQRMAKIADGASGRSEKKPTGEYTDGARSQSR